MQHEPSVLAAALLAFNMEAMQGAIGHDHGSVGRLDTSIGHRAEEVIENFAR
ncbi:MAG: hypothetical protein ACT4P0_02275 [Panacagrimonas sp.]